MYCNLLYVRLHAGPYNVPVYVQYVWSAGSLVANIYLHATFCLHFACILPACDFTSYVQTYEQYWKLVGAKMAQWGLALSRVRYGSRVLTFIPSNFTRLPVLFRGTVNRDRIARLSPCISSLSLANAFWFALVCWFAQWPCPCLLGYLAGKSETFRSFFRSQINVKGTEDD